MTRAECGAASEEVVAAAIKVAAAMSVTIALNEDEIPEAILADA
jgi:hypothetical protein